MRNARDAAAIALVIVIIKLVFRLIPPSKRFVNIFEEGSRAGLGVILTSYIVIFVIAYLILVVFRRHKRKVGDR
ncbi:Uncharacterised protein [Lysinibacillus sphaericus]|nr:Uncharacterised protein [Lysinibacillus sphaericus]